jgi:hypothetical protein
MTKRGLATSVCTAALLLSQAAAAQTQYTAQPDSPQWLKDRRYNEGIGVRTGDLELHPSVAGEVGYDSNWFLRSNKGGVDNGPSPPPPRLPAPPIPALEFRLTPALYLSTLGPQRREGDLTPQPPSVAFRAGVNATYREFIGLGSDASQPQNDISQQRNIGGAADARLDIAPSRPLGASLFGSFGRTIQPNAATANPDQSFTRDDVGAGGEIITQPGGGTLDWHFGYQFHETLFEQSQATAFDNTTHELFTRGRWKFRPRTALIYDGTFRFLSYNNTTSANQGLVDSTPVRARIGLNGLITDRFAALAIVGWGASFYSSNVAAQPQYDSVIGQAELKWFLSANPGASAAGELSLALSSISLGYTRDFQNSYLGNYYGSDRGYLKFAYFFAGRALITLEGGVGAVEYPNMYWQDGVLRHTAFTDLRTDATFFAEYRLSDSVGLNTTLRYTANFSNNQILEQEGVPGQFDMSWNRFEAYLGARWFL